MKRLLFLCTGNYYRSRFSEIFFNWAARRTGIQWKAFSRALALELGGGNVGPISATTLRGLQIRGIPVDANLRFPMQATDEDFAAADNVIALNEREHRPYIAGRYPRWESKVQYWHVEDLGYAPGEESLGMMTREVETLVQSLARSTAALL